MENLDGSIFPAFSPNDNRGCSYLFGVKAVDEFFKGTSLISIIRGHEAQQNGFKLYKWKGEESFPPVITVFSAPNYCETLKNKGAIIRIVNSTIKIHQFNSTPHPYTLADSIDLFTWSMPFMISKLQEIMNVLLPTKSSKHKITFISSNSITRSRYYSFQGKICLCRV